MATSPRNPITQGNDAYAALADTAVNKFLGSLYSSRPHYFHFATKSLGGGSTTIGLLEPIMLPGVSSAVEYAVSFKQPDLIFYATGVPAPTPPVPTIAAGEFRLHLSTTWLIPLANVAATLFSSGAAPPPLPPATGNIEVWCVGKPETRNTSTGSRVFLKPETFIASGTGNLDPIFSYLGQLVLQALLGNFSFPTELVNQGSFKLSLAKTPPNPVIDDGQLKIWANFS